ncbi:MAG: hypothetical protein WBZ36_08240 [Candidatus Nitrosopolaris sp.]
MILLDSMRGRRQQHTMNQKIGILNRDDVSAPKWFVYSTIKIPENIPTSKPAIKASFLNDLT